MVPLKADHDTKLHKRQMKQAMIVQLTYKSNHLKVKGYIAMPYGYSMPVSELKQHITSLYQDSDLPMTEVATNITPHQQDVTTKKWPVLIYCRGGIGRVGSVKTNWLEQFSLHGHLIIAPCYRGNEGGEGRDQFGGDDLEDVLSAYELARSLPFVDPERISIMGFSRGSINATQAVVRLPQIYKLILWGGVSDLTQTYEERIDLRRMMKRVIGGTPNKLPEAYLSRSPVHLAEQIHCPVLIMHGTEDIQVHPSHGLNMYNRLLSCGSTVDLHTYQGYGHHLPKGIHEDAIAKMFQWINSEKGLSPKM